MFKLWPALFFYIVDTVNKHMYTWVLSFKSFIWDIDLKWNYRISKYLYEKCLVTQKLKYADY